MQVISAKDAKLRFGELLDTMQREPVLVTKNNRPVGVFVSLKDVQGTHLEQLFYTGEDDYADWEKAKILQAIATIEKDATQVKSMQTVHLTALEKARELVASRQK
ncbi:type II toxin-antitoxin system Phd/YefM family antitoxin [Acinetobacter populi]|uniref:Antitoxin n=1 Tax=Acinetobacter populi TaxID=1582270 RepID=A0A1Z9Z198_9GAMM|nr:type II toxin-antitoxin system Phd/YefM family antitoxin [Acinetobacter populi]OUY08192.1 prevent-host-death protein [Acinetobacter populi]